MWIILTTASILYVSEWSGHVYLWTVLSVSEWSGHVYLSIVVGNLQIHHWHVPSHTVEGKMGTYLVVGELDVASVNTRSLDFHRSEKHR
jgi:hypothetical protein